MLAHFFQAVDRHRLAAWIIGTASTILSWLQLHKGDLDFWFSLLTGFFGTVTGAVTMGLMAYRACRWLRSRLRS
jgi:hypothetical protein